jgi:hypothetical protein
VPLSDLRVVELGSGPALAYAGRIFAGLGADVRKVAPPGGDAARTLPPLVDVGGGRRESAHFAWLNANRHSVIADETSAAGRCRFRVSGKRSRYSNTTSAWPSITASPSLVRMDFTTPARGATTGISIFIDSRMISVSSSCT